MSKNCLFQNLQDSIALKNKVFEDKELTSQIISVGEMLVDTFQKNKKVLWCGNGGSAADAQHLSAELSGRYYFDRPPLFSEALHVNTSYLTAVANDYSYDEIYRRLTIAMGNEGDVLIGMSTSGNSQNIINALQAAKEKGMQTVALIGKDGGKMKGISDFDIIVPSENTPRIQEVHMLIGHSWCEYIEASLFGKE